MSFLWIVFLATGLLACGGPARAQHNHSDEGGAPPEALRTDLGSLHHPIATSNPEAQEFFDQGLTLVYAFNHHAAMRSFERAAELDPKSPMPYWGLALAKGPNYNETEGEDEKGAYEAIQKARSLESSAPAVEREYVDALARRFSPDKPDIDALARNYAAAMKEVFQHYPDDPDAGTLYAEALMDQHAWALWTKDGKPAENTLEIVSVLETVLRRWPEHCGANHFYIHAMEMSPDPERALPSAYRLATLVPGAGHLVHMPSHIYSRTGDYAAAVKSNEQAIEVDKRMPGGMDVYMVYRGHNVHFLVAAAMMDGEYDVALGAAKDLVRRANAVVAEMPMVESFLPWQHFVLLRFARWDGVLALPLADPKPSPSASYVMPFFDHFARAVAFAEKRDPAAADKERSAMEAAYSKMKPDSIFGYNTWSAMHEVAAHTLDARIAAAKGDSATAIKEWRAAVDAQDRMNYDEPADWYYPVRESLGAALLQSGDPADAEKVFREDLDRDDPRNPRSLYGLWKALGAQKKTADANWVHASFEAAWKGAPDQVRLADF